MYNSKIQGIHTRCNVTNYKTAANFSLPQSYSFWLSNYNFYHVSINKYTQASNYFYMKYCSPKNYDCN